MSRSSNSPKKHIIGTIIGAVALILATSPVVAPTSPHMASYYNLQSGHSSATPIRFAGTLCYDTGYTPPRAEVC